MPICATASCGSASSASDGGGTMLDFGVGSGVTLVVAASDPGIGGPASSGVEMTGRGATASCCGGDDGAALLPNAKSRVDRRDELELLLSEPLVVEPTGSSRMDEVTRGAGLRLRVNRPVDDLPP